MPPSRPPSETQQQQYKPTRTWFDDKSVRASRTCSARSLITFHLIIYVLPILQTKPAKTSTYVIQKSRGLVSSLQ
ncbi:hypothetical protein K504DRAFT_155282 [Pleomassaria siparia CBS 279.74]|uniref:Uncharacterized protein n=1 Tax=Pleomassaria siparia CBS 279.74 TaxID=1314801 RepID=A0A6G1KMV7_9PLEO|nr:hypothetical protein K504DRAFT_155282 [Pleomassaria siparia CBS 279.74]